MRIFLFTLVLNLVASVSFAARDSVAVFYSKEKINILINERATNGRLPGFLDSLGGGDWFYWENENQTVKVHCAREDNRSSCVFTLKPDENVHFSGRSGETRVMNEVFQKSAYEMTFESSMQDKFLVKMDGQGIYIWAGKKGEIAPF